MSPVNIAGLPFKRVVVHDFEFYQPSGDMPLPA